MRTRRRTTCSACQTDSINRPVLMISTAFGWCRRPLTFVTMIALLVVVSPLLALLALLSPVPAFIADTRYGWRLQHRALGSRLLRRMNYLSPSDHDSYAKEVKLFGSAVLHRSLPLIGNALRQTAPAVSSVTWSVSGATSARSPLR